MTNNFINNSTLNSDNYWEAILYDNEVGDGLLIKDNVVVRYRGTSTSITIPNSVTSIAARVFAFYYSLTSVTIPNSVTSISYRAFSDCSSLTDVYCLAESVPQTYSNTFEGSSISSATLHVPASALGAYKSTFPWNNFKTIVAIK